MGKHRALNLPRLLEPSRRGALAGLVAVTVGEVSAHVAAAAALKALLVGAVAGGQAVTLLLVTGVMAAGLHWARDVMSERVGLDYANHVRRVLGRQALAVASRGGPGRFGTIAIRMTGDLSALKDWARFGVCGGIAGGLGLIGAVLAAWWTAGPPGLTAAVIGPSLGVLLALMLTSRLDGTVRERRRQKGRLSARIGDMLLGASASAAYAAERRAVGEMNRAARGVLEAQTRQVSVASLMRLPALVTLPFGAATAVILQSYGFSPTSGVAGWAALLFTLSLASLACSQLMEALLQVVERRIAVAKLSELVALAQTAPASAPNGRTRLKQGDGVCLSLKGRLLIEAGAHRAVSRTEASAWLPAVLFAEEGVEAGGVNAQSIRDIDWARRIAYAGPSRGLARAPIDLALAARRRASPQALREALVLAGLPQGWADHNPVIDPQSAEIEQAQLARLRLARALAHGPRVLIVDDAWLEADRCLMARVRDWCAERRVSLIEIVSEGHEAPTLRAAS